MNPFEAIDEIRRRSTEAILGQTGLNHAGLAAEIRARFADHDPRVGGLMQEPILEAALPNTSADQTMDDLSGGLLHPSLVAALDTAEPSDRRFARDLQPFAHQLRAWTLLRAADQTNSVLITSGTGSGKTECFLVPILDDLARQAEVQAHRLEGVQAIMLYPLNALIASQEERLRAWTAPFGGKLRFALYNGLLPDHVRAGSYVGRPEVVPDRRVLRETPPPMLVTNVTMLEYMLLRPQDAQILAKSQGKLRYVVLDEAHSYVGAKAAEIALLLRRVCLAFGVDPADVRFIATSATIGSGKDVTAQLRRFLADVSGAPEDRVHVVEGQTRRPSLPPLHDGAGPDLDAFAHLGGHPKVRPLIERIYDGPTPWSAVATVAAEVGRTPTELAVSLANAVSATGDRLAPLRVHSFHRAAPGLWSCLDPACSQPRPVDWPFGAIHHEIADRCRCGAPLFEIVSCAECGEPYLDAQETSATRLARPPRGPGVDDFALDADRDIGEADGDDDAAAPETAGERKLIALKPHGGAMRWLFAEGHTGQVHDKADAEGLTRLPAYDHLAPHVCPACQTRAQPGADLIRPIRFGAPFILGTATPVLLEGAARAPEADDPERWTQSAAPPVMGRQLLSFTDSRQGTARLSAKLQIASERNFVRAFVYHAVQDQLATNADPAAIAEIDAAIAALEPGAANSQVFAGLLEQQRKSRAALLALGEGGIAWRTMVERLAGRPEVRVWLKEVWQRRDARFGSETDLAEFLLLREFLRRPPKANTPETMGLARLRFAAIDDIKEVLVPQAWRDLGLHAGAWRDFLYLLLTYVARGRSAIRVAREVLHWIPPKAVPRDLVFRPEGPVATFQVLWPRFGAGALRRTPMVVNLLEQASGRSLDDPSTRQTFNDIFDTAWHALGPVVTQSSATNRALDLRLARIAPVVQGFLCPVTRRVLDVTLNGLSPYGAKSRGVAPRTAEPVVMPRHPLPFRGEARDIPPIEAHESIAEWLANDPALTELRSRGAWSDLGDRIAQFSDYFRSAEHSAQQSPQKLRRYEREFKAGSINVLNCSTTMEMGVDIGSVSHVMMTNLPPSVANYRQRVGRAGRRGQPLSMAFTFCRDRPLERDAFRDPARFLRRSLAAPSVALQSNVIVQRHINALLFAAFVRESGVNGMTMEAGPFFGCPAPIGAPEETENAAARMVAWARDPQILIGFAEPLLHLTRNSRLEGDTGVFESAAAMMERTRNSFADTWRVVQALAAARGDDAPAARNLEIQLKRMCGDYLLGVLADRGVLPGHGFPTDVVSFISRQDPPDTSLVEEVSRFNAFPQRGLEAAIREYVPGSEVVLDGLVHRSAGVTLNWRRPADLDGVRQVQAIKHRWRCKRCGESGVVQNRDLDRPECPACLTDNLDWVEFLQPAGFAADLRNAPHADADVVTYVAAEPTVVSAKDAPWTPLFDPSRGRRRADPDGSVFFCNAGPSGAGYAVCLYCGRAGDNAAAPHAPLIGKGADCEGPAKGFGVKPNLHLGHQIRTDVFEFQPAAWLNAGGALALAIALREALAQRLGISADEMGLAAEPRLDALGAQTMSIFLHDKASGGAGFSVKAHELFADLLRDVDRILDCRVVGCERGCPACVLVGELNDEQVARLDRRPALALVRERLLADGRPDEEDRAVETARFSLDLLDEIRQAMEGGAIRLTLRLGGELDLGTLATWIAAPLAAHWVGRGRDVVLGVDRGIVDRLNGAERLALRDLVNRWGVRLEEGEASPCSNDAQILAEVISRESHPLVFASRDVSASSGSIGWGRPEAAPIVRFETSSPVWVGAPVSLNRLREPAGAALRNVTTELDGPISSFGDRTAGLIRDLLEQAGVAKDEAVVGMAYEDRYLKSPLSLRLCIDTLGRLRGPGAGAALVPLTLRTFPVEPTDRQLQFLDGDWRVEDDRSIVAAILAKARGLAIDWRLGRPPHGRRLVLTFANGRSAEVVLDQGFGAWRSNRGSAFDFHRLAARQAVDLQAVATGVHVAPGGNTYIVANARA
ncbi:MAG TPA: DEAD/DEAH box helicase [Caulobacteraceae bacterium]|jgi:ATP-dependent helicase YprA (DUF1998 family)